MEVLISDESKHHDSRRFLASGQQALAKLCGIGSRFDLTLDLITFLALLRQVGIDGRPILQKEGDCCVHLL